jgi:hypothetical protein
VVPVELIGLARLDELGETAEAVEAAEVAETSETAKPAPEAILDEIEAVELDIWVAVARPAKSTVSAELGERSETVAVAKIGWISVVVGDTPTGVINPVLPDGPSDKTGPTGSTVLGAPRGGERCDEWERATPTHNSTYRQSTMALPGASMLSKHLRAHMSRFADGKEFSKACLQVFAC